MLATNTCDNSPNELDKEPSNPTQKGRAVYVCVGSTVNEVVPVTLIVALSQSGHHAPGLGVHVARHHNQPNADGD